MLNSFESDKDSVEWITYEDERISRYGLATQDDRSVFCRLPAWILPQLPDNLRRLAYCTAGARLRFRTDSPFIRLTSELRKDENMRFIGRGGVTGFDLYSGEGGKMSFCKVMLPDLQTGEIDVEYKFRSESVKDILIHFPLFLGIQRFQLGLKPGSLILKPKPYQIQDPVVFYGSSITQGAYASRPGNSYPHLLSRWLDADIYNLGFSGNAKGEQILAEYIAQLTMNAFVLDYDHNAPTPAILEETHFRFYETIRKTRPELPIFLVSRPDFDLHVEDSVVRRAIIQDTYRRGNENGDKKLWFVDGETLFGEQERDACTVDTCHPNDLGFMRIAEVLYSVIKQVLD